MSKITLFFLVIISLLYVIFPDLNWFNSHMSRDVSRALNIYQGNFNNWLGPEIGYGGARLPGPFYNIFLSVFLIFKSISFLIVAKGIVLVSSLYFLYYQAQKSLMKYESIWWFLLLISNPLIIFSGRNLWNPSLILFFTCLSLGVFYKSFRISLSRVDFLLLGLIPFLSVQVHLSTLLPHVLILSTLILKGNKAQRWKLISTILPVIFLLVFWRVGLVKQDGLALQINNTFIADSISFEYILKRVSQLTYHLTHHTDTLNDYDIFFVLNNEMSKIYPNLFSVLNFFESFFRIIWKAILLISMLIIPFV